MRFMPRSPPPSFASKPHWYQTHQQQFTTYLTQRKFIVSCTSLHSYQHKSNLEITEEQSQYRPNKPPSCPLSKPQSATPRSSLPSLPTMSSCPFTVRLKFILVLYICTICRGSTRGSRKLTRRCVRTVQSSARRGHQQGREARHV